MTFDDLSNGEIWMTEDEHRVNKLLLNQFQEQFKAANTPLTPLLILRVNDVIVSFLLARRIEAQLAALNPPPANHADKSEIHDQQDTADIGTTPAEASEPAEAQPKGDKRETNTRSGEDAKASATTVIHLAESIGKARERMRKAMKELDDTCKPPADAPRIGLADELRPLMPATKGLDREIFGDEGEPFSDESGKDP